MKKMLFKEIEKETKDIKTYLGGFGKIIYELNDTLNYWEKNGFNKLDTVWSITKDLDVFPKYAINLGGDKISLERMRDNERLTLEDLEKWNTLSKFLESDKYIFYDIRNNTDYSRLYTTKPEMSSKRLSNVDNIKSHITGKFLNDIDGGLCFWPEGKISDNKVFTLVYGSDIKDYINKQEDDFEIKNLIARERLLKTIENSKITDNPILMVVTLKE